MKVIINCIDRKDGNICGVLEKDLVEYTEWLERAIDRKYDVYHANWMGKNRVDVLATTRSSEKCDFVVEFIEEEVKR